MKSRRFTGLGGYPVHRRRPGRAVRIGSLKPATGFGLVELLVALAVAGILASIALPSYAAYMERTRRIAARVALVQAAHWLERMATATGRYPDASAMPAGLLRVDGGHYRLAAEVDSMGTAFTLQATPQGTQAGDRCGTLTLSHSGLREIFNAATDITADACWNR